MKSPAPTSMGPSWSRWLTPVIVLSYVAASNLALASQSRLWMTIAVTLFVWLVVRAITHRRSTWIVLIFAIAGILLILGVVEGSLPPVPLMLPPVVVPAAIAWLFGHTLMAGREPLVERFARAVSAPEPLDAEHARYARRVTVMWTAVLISMTACNAYLVTCLSPGGLLDQFGYEPLWPVDIRSFLWASNGVYLLVPMIMVVEFLFRIRRFPNYPLKNPLAFVRRARERLPAVVEEVRRG